MCRSPPSLGADAERLGNQAGMASSYHELGILDHRRGDYDTAEARYKQSLTIFERLGNQAGMATSYHQLGILAQARGDHDTAPSSQNLRDRIGQAFRLQESVRLTWVPGVFTCPPRP